MDHSHPTLAFNLRQCLLLEVVARDAREDNESDENYRADNKDRIRSPREPLSQLS